MRGGRTPTERRDDPALRLVLLVAVVALMPVERDLTIWSLPDAVGNYHLRVGMSAFHVPLTALVVLSVAEAARGRQRPRAPVPVLCTVAAAWLAICFLAAPTWRGVDALFHLVAAWAIWDTVRSADRPGRLVVLVAVCVLGVFESLLALAQRILNDHVGIDLIETAGSFTTADGLVAVRGSFLHQYHFVELALLTTAVVFWLLAREESGARSWLVAALALLGLVVPMTFSRAAILAVVPMLAVVGAVAWRYGRRLRVAILVWTVGLTTGFLTSLGAIEDRASNTLSGDLRSFDSGRLERLQEAWDLARDHPITGVGPGNYVAELRDARGLAADTGVKVLPPHDFVAHYAAEAGFVGGILAIVLLVALGLWAIRGGPLRILVALPLVPYLLLDLFPYTWQEGIVLSGLWLALAQIAGEDDRAGVSSAGQRVRPHPLRTDT